jgi:hypothetical protein
MGSRVRPLNHEDLEHVRSFADLVKYEPRKKLALLGENEYGLRVIFKKVPLEEIHIKMPSGNVFVRDLRETGFQLDKSLLESGYSGDMSLNGEVANAISYSNLIMDVYLHTRSLA